MRAIVGIGGGELRLGETLAIDQYIVSLTDALTPHVAFLPTASGDDPGVIERFTVHYQHLGCSVDAVCLYHTPEALRERLLAADIIYVGGGDTRSMLATWRALGVDQLLREAWERGAVLCGISAGLICWGQQGFSQLEDDSYAMLTGLGLVDAILCPHYGDAARRQAFDDAMCAQALPGIGLEDGVALSVLDGRMTIVRSRPDAKAYLLRWQGGALSRQIYDGGFLRLSSDAG